MRGAFAFGPNQHPVQDWFALQVVKDGDGKLALKTGSRVFKAKGDAYAEAVQDVGRRHLALAPKHDPFRR